MEPRPFSAALQGNAVFFQRTKIKLHEQMVFACGFAGKYDLGVKFFYES